MHRHKNPDASRRGRSLKGNIREMLLTRGVSIFAMVTKKEITPRNAISPLRRPHPTLQERIGRQTSSISATTLRKARNAVLLEITAAGSINESALGLRCTPITWPFTPHVKQCEYVCSCCSNRPLPAGSWLQGSHTALR